jgi:hypothetical protein
MVTFVLHLYVVGVELVAREGVERAEILAS